MERLTGTKSGMLHQVKPIVIRAKALGISSAIGVWQTVVELIRFVIASVGSLPVSPYFYSIFPITLRFFKKSATIPQNSVILIADNTKLIV